jgi:phenylpropionate dioxygenase-like ring-hydroxylating dioxygenase large terminal subunit
MASSHELEKERWTDKLGMSRAPISLEDTVCPEFYELEKEAVFRRSWLFVGRVEQVPNPGDYFTKEMENLKASVLVTRDREKGIRVFHNVCPHRGNKLMWDTYAHREVAGRCRMFVCKFHGIAFGTQGNATKVTDPGSWMDGQEKGLHLAEVPFEIWNGFIFVNLDPNGPAQSLRDFLGDHFWTGFDGYPFEVMTQRFSARGIANCNWKVMMDAFAEVYHAPTTHKRTFPAIAMIGEGDASAIGDYYGVEGQHRQYVMSAYPDDFYQFQYERDTTAFGTGPRYHDTSEGRTLPHGANPTQVENWGTACSMLFPNFYLEIYPTRWILTYLMVPLAYNKMRFEVDIWTPPATNFSDLLSQKAFVQMYLETALEDFSLVEAQQAGLEARAFKTYPLTDEEVCVRHLHQEIAKVVEAYQANQAAGE